MHSWFKWCLLLLFPVIQAFGHTATNNKQEIVVGLITFPPFIQKEDDGKCHGLAIDDLKKVFPAPQYILTFYCASPSRIYRDFNTGFIDITINVKTTESLSKHILYSKKPYQILEVFRYSHTNTNDNRIASIRSYNYDGVREQLERDGYEFVDLANTKEAIAVFLRQGAGSILSYKKPFEHYLQKGRVNKQYRELNMSFTQESLGKVPTYFGVNTLNKNAQNIVDLIDEYFAVLSD